MPRTLLQSSRLFALAVAFASVASCGGGEATTGVTGDAPTGLLSLPPLIGGSNPSLLACDAPATDSSTTGVIGPLGGLLAIGGTQVLIPANAVLVPTTFRLTIPASRLVEISVRAGSAEHFLFEKPVLVTIDYGRCAGAVPLSASLSAWHIDETSKSLLENMSGVDLRLLHTITFYTGHLSGYAVAD
jgi:hypothetical protein